MKRIAFAGFLWSLAALTKPATLYLPLFLAWLWRKDKKALVVWLISAYLLPLAWALHNKLTMGSFTFTTQSTSQIRDYLASGVASLDHDIKYGQLESDNLNVAAYLLSHKASCVHYFMNGTIKLFGLTEFEAILEYFGIDRTNIPLNESGRLSGEGTLLVLKLYPWLWLPFLAFSGFLVMFYGYFLVSIRLSNRQDYLLYGTILWLWVLSALAYGAPRYRIAILPLMAVSIAKRIKT